MAKRYDSFNPFNDAGAGDGDDCPYGWIGEWLCEYVDGTMDPSMQAVFEEYLEANPELEAHVERLCHTRALLNGCACREEAAERAKAGLHRAREESAEAEPAEATAVAQVAQIEAEIEKLIAGDDDPAAVPVNAATMVAVASAMTLMLGLGVAVGAAFFAEPLEATHAPVSVSQTVPDAVDQAPSPAEAASSGEAASAGAEAAPAALQGDPAAAIAPLAFGDASSSAHAPRWQTSGPLPLGSVRQGFPHSSEESVWISSPPALIQPAALNPRQP